LKGEYGKTEPFYFFLKPSYWFPSKHQASPATNLVNLDLSAEDFEPVADDLIGKEAIR